MKITSYKYIISICLLLLLTACVAYAGGSERLLLNETHSVILNFTNDIKYVDFGIGAISGERLSSPKMLKLRSLKPYFDESTISVVTSDGGYHQFTASYAESLDRYVWQQSGSVILPDSIGLSTVKTTHFICDEKITDIVVSSPSVIAEYAERIDNIVKAKALDRGFRETNIQLVTQSGQIYTFNVRPEESPERLSVMLSSDDDAPQSSQAIFKSNSVNDIEMRDFARRITSERPSINDIGVVSLKMAFAMSGIYSYNDMLAFRLEVTNRGRIDYVIDFIKGYIRDKSDTNTAAMQEEELSPVYIYYSDAEHPQEVRAGESETVVLFFPRFTIPSKRILQFEIFERNGGRHLSFQVSSKELLKARALVGNPGDSMRIYNSSPLSHIKGMHAIGFRAGTGVGKTYDIGVHYQYHFSRWWSFFTDIDYEKGRFDATDYWGFKAYPGVECRVWHPASWFYLHLLGDINLGYDEWKDTVAERSSSGFVLGLDLGLNFEFYALPELSFVLQAMQGWDWGFYDTGGYNYFHPLFTLAVKYNIK